MTTAKQDLNAETKPKRTRTTTGKKVIEKKKEAAVEPSIVEMLMKEIEALKMQLSQKEDEKEEIVEVKKTTNKRERLRTTFNEIRDVEVEVKRVIGGIGSVKYIDRKTGDEYIWTEEGSSEYMTVDVLRRMNSQAPLFLKAPWLRILDNDEAIEVLGLKEIYHNIDLIEDIDELVKLKEHELEQLVESLSLEYKNVLATNIMDKVNLEELNNINAIRRFERVLQKEFLV